MIDKNGFDFSPSKNCSNNNMLHAMHDGSKLQLHFKMVMLKKWQLQFKMNLTFILFFILNNFSDLKYIHF